MLAPKCVLCHQRHWLREPHVYADVPRRANVNVSRETLSETIHNQEPIPSREQVIAEAGLGRRYDWAQREAELGLAPLAKRQAKAYRQRRHQA